MRRTFWWWKRSLAAFLLVSFLFGIGNAPVLVRASDPAADFVHVPLATPPADLPQEPAVRLVVGFQPTAAALDRRALIMERELPVRFEIPALQAAVVSVPAGTADSFAASLREHPLVRYVEPDTRTAILGDPNDPYYAGYQWNFPIIRAPQAWDIATGHPDITIAIVDTGMDLTHPDLTEKLVPGYDFVQGDDIPQDDHGHGTHCAGIAAAVTNNGDGVAGMDWGARLMPVKVLDLNGQGWDSDVAQGLVWAVDHGADVVNLSLGSSNASSILADALEYARGHDVVVVAAAGNTYHIGNTPTYPAAYDYAMAVAATGAEDEHAFYSTAGEYVDVAAPGGNSHNDSSILSTYGTEFLHWYAFSEGTSMAAPHVAGLAALLRAANPSLSAEEIRAIILSTAKDLGDPGFDPIFGWGRVDALAALSQAGEVVLYLEPEESATAVGATFRVDMLLSTGSQPVDSVSAVLRFDPALLQVVDAAGNPTTSIISGDSFSLLLANSVDNSAGLIHYDVSRAFGETPPAGELRLASIRFRTTAQTLNPAGTMIEVSPESEAFFGGVPLIDRHGNARVTVQAPWFSGSVKLQGHGAAPNARWRDYPLRVSLLDAGGALVGQYDAHMDEAGQFALLDVPSRTFDIRVKGEHSLSTILHGATIPSLAVLDLGVLREGDANGDDRVTGADFSLLATAYATGRGDARWDARVDFNDDGRVSAADFSLLATNYALEGPLPAGEAPFSQPDVWTRHMTIRMSPVRQLVLQGQEFDVAILLDTQTLGADAVDILLGYDPNVLELVDEAGRPADEIMGADVLPLQLENRVDSEAGRIYFSAGVQLGDEPLAGTVVEVARLRFRALRSTRNGMGGTPIRFLPGTEAYWEGHPTLNEHHDAAVVVALGSRRRP